MNLVHNIHYYYIPKFVRNIMLILVRNNFDAFLVGGCIRDDFLKRPCNDYDIVTDAEPWEIKKCFEGNSLYKVSTYDTDHGTIQITNSVSSKYIIEITPYRDHSRNLKEDLKHRDFTINAIACDYIGFVKDPQNGICDLTNRIIRCCGDSKERFVEDPLRILRAIRFASYLKFDIEYNTKFDMFHWCSELNSISKERIFDELCKILLSDNCSKLLLDYKYIIYTIIPELKKCVDFNQNNPNHNLDVYDHMITSIDKYESKQESYESDLCIKFALFLHDIGKPECYSEDENGVGHFYNHAEKSEEIARRILTDLHCPNKWIEHITTLIKYHDYEIGENKKSVNKLISKIGFNMVKELLEVKKADIKAQSQKFTEYKLENISLIEHILDNINEDYSNKKVVFGLKDLMIDGNDLLNIGIPEGPKIGKLLNLLLNTIIEGNLNNTYDDCINFALHNLDKIE